MLSFHHNSSLCHPQHLHQRKPHLAGRLERRPSQDQSPVSTLTQKAKCFHDDDDIVGIEGPHFRWIHLAEGNWYSFAKIQRLLPLNTCVYYMSLALVRSNIDMSTRHFWHVTLKSKLVCSHTHEETKPFTSSSKFHSANTHPFLLFQSYHIVNMTNQSNHDNNRNYYNDE